VQDLAGRQTGP